MTTLLRRFVAVALGLSLIGCHENGWLSHSACNHKVQPYQYVSTDSTSPRYKTFWPLASDDASLDFFVLETTSLVDDFEPYKNEELFGFTISISWEGGKAIVDRVDLPLPEDALTPVQVEGYEYEPTRGILAFTLHGQHFELVSCEGFYSQKFRESYKLR